ncbi:hypothetical protein BDW42DRAFT_171638 [Aspergillus taichungensis]|uniref:Uncharacterized protein n=1 Tax=Aspergillus taichungensis TaxID=482145 RepID=A0A2J5HRZ2_9EURO|nr:hypothetical protein BDW42DRAFT_171638 [Aspergillus taichungensis]
MTISRPQHTQYQITFAANKLLLISTYLHNLLTICPRPSSALPVLPNVGETKREDALQVRWI